MKKSKIYLLLASFFLLLLAGCEKDTPASNPVIDVCQLPNGFVRWADANGSYCATTAFADEAIEMTINGISTNGPSITLTLNDYGVGSHPITETGNSIFYTSALGFSYLSSNSNPGTLTITSYSSTNHQIKGSFQTTFYDPAGILPPTNLSGNFSLYYTF